MSDRFGLSATALKFWMAAFMLLDHLYYFFPGMPIWFTYLGRMVAPTFCYLMTQSLRHTRDREAYLRRMTVAGLLMLLGSILLQLATGGPTIHNTIFLSLAASGEFVCRLDQLWQEGVSLRPLVRAAVALGVAVLFLEGSYLIPVIAVIFYFLDHNKPLMCLSYGVIGALVVFSWRGMPAYQHLQVVALGPILLYNGRRGCSNSATRWFFYVFYPVHIWAFYLIQQYS